MKILKPIFAAFMLAGVLVGCSKGEKEKQPSPEEIRKQVYSLMDDLRNEDEKKRAKAALDLGNLGGKASNAVPALANSLKDKSSSVRKEALVALGKMGQKANDAYRAVFNARQDSNANIREIAEDTLLKIRKDSDPKPKDKKEEKGGHH